MRWRFSTKNAVLGKFRGMETFHTGVVLPSPDVICLKKYCAPLRKTIFEFRKSSQNTDKQFVLEGHF